MPTPGGRIAHFTDRGHPFHADRGHRFTLMADGVQRVRVPGVHRISGVRDGREAARVVHAGDAIAGVGNTAPKAMVG
jgi:hypothetical protein